MLVLCFMAKTLNLEIFAYHPITKTTKKYVHNILLNVPWCEPTINIGKFLLVTTNAYLQDGQQWLDGNLPPMFANYISKHPSFVPDINHLVAKCADY